MLKSGIYTAPKIFTGDIWLTDHAIIIKDNLIDSIVPINELSSSDKIKSWPDCIIVPSFIDLQIYGAYSKLLAVCPEPDSLYKLKEYCESGGAAFCLPTVATNTTETFYNCIDAVREYWNSGGGGILGLHLEGPWINTAKRGAHIESLIHSPSLPEVKELLEYGKGIIKMITLAPEVCSKEVIDCILSYDIIISAGHSNATYTEAKAGFANGITAVTHLYNAMSPLQHRQPGLTGATMEDNRVMASIIPDGYHVDFAAIKIAKKLMAERLFVITDAVTETTKGYYLHQLNGDKYEAAGILSGSALLMDKALKNLVDHCGIELGEALRMCSLYPAKVIKMNDQLGKIEKGFKAALTILNRSYETVKVIC
ncbi:MAG TPA: N-acetylglucosamine-6-phosphate deacetylase [Chitinophagaceae bacterium]|nr:N-acetylglucosamine-6-phosphate deacetylase [Chitinophagaceae bacterium]